MTVLGKILVFVNLAFSVVTAGLIVVAFTTRTNWKAGYDDAVKKLQVANAVLTAERATSSEEAKRREDEVKAARASAAAKDVEIAQLKTKIDDTEKQLVMANKLRDDETATRTVSTAELERIRMERQALQDQMATLQGKLNDTTKQMVAFRDASVSNDIRYKAEHERNLRLLEQVAALNQMVAKVKDQGTVRTDGLAVKTPPPEDVRGTVTSTDRESGLATISIGSDAGLAKNNVLHIYRLEPSPTYLGTLQVLNTRPHEAVGRYNPSQKRMPLQVGDEVASKIVAPTAAGGR
jgi:hypothetical protein